MGAVCECVGGWLHTYLVVSSVDDTHHWLNQASVDQSMTGLTSIIPGRGGGNSIMTLIIRG